MQESMLNNPEYCLLFERQAVAFNNLAERLEGLNLPQQTYDELLSGLRDLEDASAELAKYEKLHEIRFLWRQELAKMPGINVDAICPESPATV